MQSEIVTLAPSEVSPRPEVTRSNTKRGDWDKKTLQDWPENCVKLQQSVSFSISLRPAKRSSILTMKRSVKCRQHGARIHVQRKRLVKGVGEGGDETGSNDPGKPCTPQKGSLKTYHRIEKREMRWVELPYMLCGFKPGIRGGIRDWGTAGEVYWSG